MGPENCSLGVGTWRRLETLRKAVYQDTVYMGKKRVNSNKDELNKLQWYISPLLINYPFLCCQFVLLCIVTHPEETKPQHPEPR